jgi:hypothetical protein
MNKRKFKLHNPPPLAEMIEYLEREWRDRDRGRDPYPWPSDPGTTVAFLCLPAEDVCTLAIVSATAWAES